MQLVSDLLQTFKAEVLEVADVLELRLLPHLVPVLIDTHIVEKSFLQLSVHQAHFVKMALAHLTNGSAVT